MSPRGTQWMFQLIHQGVVDLDKATGFALVVQLKILAGILYISLNTTNSTDSFSYSRSECFKCQEPKGDAQDAPDSGNDGGAAGEVEKPKESYIPQEANEDEIFTFGISTGINFCKFNDIPVKVAGDNIPPPCKTFADAGLRQFVLDNIERGGYKNPTPVQQNAIPIILAGRDIMACAQTGSGKTAVRQIKELLLVA